MAYQVKRPGGVSPARPKNDGPYFSSPSLDNRISPRQGGSVRPVLDVDDPEHAPLIEALNRALKEASLAYRFSPSSYTYHAMIAVRHLSLKLRGGEQ